MCRTRDSEKKKTKMSQEYTLQCVIAHAADVKTRLLDTGVEEKCVARVDGITVTLFMLFLTPEQADACRKAGLDIELEQYELGTCDMVRCHLVCARDETEQYKRELEGYEAEVRVHGFNKVALVLEVTGPEFERLQRRFPGEIREGEPVTCED
jgi:hypothetical protein